jgi:hypothetical protein
MQDLINQCLKLIIKDNVDETLFAFHDIYFWYVQKNFSGEAYKSQNVLKNFLDNLAATLTQNDLTRHSVTREEIENKILRDKETIAEIIQEYLNPLAGMDGIVFLGRLIGTYSVIVPEPLFRVASSFRGIHQTPDISPVDDNLPMSDEMISFCWQYFWFYAWLGY